MAKKRSSKGSRKPANQAIPGVSSRSGTAPPAEHSFKPGKSGNPAGRPSAGASVKEWWNQMQGWSEGKILAVTEDPDAPVNKKVAAKQWLKACGEDNLAGNAIDRILEHTDGKPTQHTDLTSNGQSIEFFERETWEEA